MQQRDERRFLKEAAAIERFQAAAARLALAKSKTPAVRSLASGLLAEEHPTDDELVRFLHQRALAPPMFANEQRRTLNRLAKLQGRKFDREFLSQVALRSQQDEVQAYERATATTTDPVLRSWIERSLPNLRHRLAAAEHETGPGPRSGGETAAGPGPAGVNAARAIASRPNEWNSR